MDTNFDAHSLRDNSFLVKRGTKAGFSMDQADVKGKSKKAIIRQKAATRVKKLIFGNFNANNGSSANNAGIGHYNG